MEENRSSRNTWAAALAAPWNHPSGYDGVRGVLRSPGNPYAAHSDTETSEAESDGAPAAHPVTSGCAAPNRPPPVLDSWHVLPLEEASPSSVNLDPETHSITDAFTDAYTDAYTDVQTDATDRRVLAGGV